MNERKPAGTPRNQEEREPARRPRRRRKRVTVLGVLLYLIFVVGVSALLAGLGWVWANDVLALNKPEHTAVITLEDEIFTVKNGVETADVSYVADLLKENGLIEYKWLFRLFAAVSSADEKLAPGTYEMDTDMDYRAIVTNMGSRSASRMTTTVTIPEGYTLDQIFELLDEAGVSSVAKLNDMAANHNYKFSFLQEIPLGDPHRLEGYLFPDTYDFYLGEDAKYVINKMLINFDARVTDELRKVIADKGKTIHEIVIAASLIEKETDGTDQGKIASVIYNRLNSNVTQGKLEIDATVQYALPERKDKLTYEDLQVDSPYNTYLYAGLPVGPIASPGMASIRAAIYPESTNCYWYLLGNDNVHHFFSSYDSFINYKNSLG